MSVELDGTESPDEAQGDSFYREIGRAVRAMRRRRDMTLATLSSESGLSPSFLSQMERGLVRASYLSLNRVAKAVGVTVQELMGIGADATANVVRAHEGEVFDDARLLVRGNRALRAMEFTHVPEEFGDAYSHPEEELLYVIEGVVEYETGSGERTLLGAGDTIYLPANVRHRWRRVGGGPMRALMVSEVTADER